MDMHASAVIGHRSIALHGASLAHQFLLTLDCATIATIATIAAIAKGNVVAQLNHAERRRGSGTPGQSPRAAVPNSTVRPVLALVLIFDAF